MGFFCGCHLASPHFTTRCHCGSAPGLSGSKDRLHLGGATARPTGRPVGSEDPGRSEQRPGKGSPHICASCGRIHSLNTTCFGPSARQRRGRLTRSPLLSPVGGWECRRPLPSPWAPSQFLSASNLYNSRGVTVGWFDSKNSKLFFYCRIALDNTCCSLNLCRKNGTGTPEGQGVPSPIPASPPPPRLSVPGLPASWKATPQRQLPLLPRQACGGGVRTGR